MAEVLTQFCRSNCFTRNWKHWDVTIWCSLSIVGINSIGHPQGSLQLPKYIVYIDCRKIKLSLFLPTIYSLLYCSGLSMHCLQFLCSGLSHWILMWWRGADVSFLVSNLYVLQGNFCIFLTYIWKLMARLTMFVRSTLIFVLYSLKRLQDHHWT